MICVKALEAAAKFTAAYEAKFDYSLEVTEEQIAPLMDQDGYQYGLVSQAPVSDDSFST